MPKRVSQKLDYLLPFMRSRRKFERRRFDLERNFKRRDFGHAGFQSDKGAQRFAAGRRRRIHRHQGARLGDRDSSFGRRLSDGKAMAARTPGAEHRISGRRNRKRRNSGRRSAPRTDGRNRIFGRAARPPWDHKPEPRAFRKPLPCIFGRGLAAQRKAKPRQGRILGLHKNSQSRGFRKNGRRGISARADGGSA